MTGSAHANRVVAGAIAMATIAGCGLSLTIALLAVRLDAAGFSARAIGFNTAAGGVAALVGAPAIPWAERRVGVGRLLFIALALGGVALLAFAVTADYSAWLGLRFVFGINVCILFVLSEYWIGAAAAPHRRGLAIGLYATSLGLGFAAGPILLTFVGTSGVLPFVIGAGLLWIAILPLLLTMAGAPALEARSRKPFWIFLREAPTATLAGLLHGALEIACIGLLPLYALRAGASVEEGALFASLFVMGSCLLQVPLGLLSDRVDRPTLLAVIASVGLAGALVLAWSGLSSMIGFEIILFLWGGTIGGLYPVGLAHLSARYRDGDLAGANAAFVMTYSLGMLIGPPLIGIGLDLIPPGGFFLAIAGLIALYWLIAAVQVLRRRTRPAQSFS